MSISKEEVKKIAKLSKIILKDEEVSSMQGELSKIMDLIDQVKSVACDSVEPLCSVHEQGLKLREDRIEMDTTREDLLSNVPGESKELAKDINCFIVPKVVE